MAEKTEKVVEVRVEADEAIKTIDEIKAALAATQKELADFKKATEKAEKSSHSFGAGIKKVGQVMAGFVGGAIFMKLFEKIASIFMSNEKITKTLEKAFNFLQIVVNKIVDAVSSAIEKVSAMTGGFEASKKVIGGLVDGALNMLLLSMNSIIFGIKELQLGWKKLFDKKDTEGIKNLTKEIDGLKTNIKDASKNIVKDVKQVATNAVGMVQEVAMATTEIVKSSTTALKNIDIKATMSLADRLTTSKEYYEKLAIAAQKNIDKLEHEAEAQRQLRDDTRLSFEDRKKASDELIKKNEEQYNAAQKLVEAHIGQAKAALALNNTEENRIALLTAEAEKEKIMADYEGKKSEQKAANVGLISEEQASITALTQAEWDRYVSEKQYQIEREKDFNKNIELQRNLLKETLIRNQEEYKRQSENMQITQAERDMALKNIKKAQNDYNIAVQKLDDQTTQKNIDNQKEIYNNVITNTKSTFDEKKKAIEELAKLELDNLSLTEEQKKQIKIKSNNDIKTLDDERKQKIIDSAQQSVDMVRNIDEQYTQFKQNLLQNQLKNGEISQTQFDKKSADLEKKAALRKKAYAISETIINTASSIMSMMKMGVPMGPILAVAAGVLGAAQVATIMSTSPGSGSASSPSTSISTSSGSGSSDTAPTTSFSFADAPKTMEQPVSRTYVIAKEVTNQQQLDREIRANGLI